MHLGKVIRTALIGFGYRGRYLYKLLRAIPEFKVVAVADPNEKACQCLSDDEVQCFCFGDDDYLRMLSSCDLDFVVIASPWHLHHTQAHDCIASGIDVGLEIKGAQTLLEYNSLIETARLQNVRIFPLENSFFMHDVLAVYRMIQEGVFGELVSLKGGYKHDLRSVLIDESGNFGRSLYSESFWRAPYYETENGDIYPTHGLAPLCMFLGVNRTTKIVSLTSFSTKQVGIKTRIKELGGAEHPDLKRSFSLGDVITTVMELDDGAQIILTHDTTLPRPKSLGYEVQGTKGIWNAELKKIYIEGITAKDSWEDDAPILAQYKHPFWKKWGEEALRVDVHHQGMDYIMLRALCEELLGLGSYPFLAQDLETWALVTPLSKQSIKEKRMVDFFS